MGGYTGFEIPADLWVKKKLELLENTKSLMSGVSLEIPHVAMESNNHTSVGHPPP